jgi:hypothetical protein
MADDTEHGRNVLTNGRLAPKCMIRFRCPECNREAIEDAFLGAVLCMCKKPFGTAMEALSVVRDVIEQGYHPDSTSRVMAGKHFRGKKIPDDY